MQATYGRSVLSAWAIWFFYIPAPFICYIVECLKFLWATAELQDSWFRGLSFQMGNFCFLPGTACMLNRLNFRRHRAQHLLLPRAALQGSSSEVGS